MLAAMMSSKSQSKAVAVSARYQQISPSSFFELFPVQLMTLRQPFFDDVNGLAGLAAQTHHTIDEYILFAEGWIQRLHGKLLVFVDGHKSTPFLFAYYNAAVWKSLPCSF